MPTRNELKELARLRLKEAENLFDAGLYDGSAYLCGYVIEFALKARICRLLQIDEYPVSGKFKTAYAVHDFKQLLLLSGLKSKMDSADVEVYTNWSLLITWSPEMRYRPKGSVLKDEVELLLNAVRKKPNGVFRWIMKYW